MKDDEYIVSGFGSEGGGDASLKVDFATAKLLGRGGSTCEAYECVIQRRRVFVKRLKTQFRDNPFYRAAFDKEYDLGISLSHPSLPRYVGLGPDYIIMDYIEGETLADLIRRGDLRHKDKEFCRKILSELVDVVEYLHYRNIVHCDIKADNIMVSPYAGRPVTLIDFDKAYTAWLDSTAGDPAKYDCDDCADGRIDYCGIGRIAARLGQKRVAAVCQNKDTDIDAIRRALGRSGDRSRKWIWIIPIIIAMVCVAMLWKVDRKDGVGEAPDSSLIMSADTISEEHDSDTVTAPVAGMQDQNPGQPVGRAADGPADDTAKLDEIVKRHYGPLSRRHDYLRELAADPMATESQLRQVIASYVADQTEAQNQIISKVIGLYGLGEPLEAVVILGRNDGWNRFMKHDTEINQLYRREIERRRQEETRPCAVTTPSMPVQTDSVSP